MLGHQSLAGDEDESGAIECPTVALDDPHHDMQIQFIAPRSELLGFGPRTNDCCIPVAPEQVATPITAAAHLGTEIRAFRIAAQQRLGKHQQAYACLGCLPTYVFDLDQ